MNKETTFIDYELEQRKKINKITTLWAFSEAALGGILHALKIPFTGLFIGSSAVVFISLIAYFSDSREEILKSTLKVILVKFIVSPHSPLPAYFAVMLQGLLGYILFFKGYNKISPIFLGLFSLFFSAIQKIFILTLIYGMTLWESVDIFFNFVIESVFGKSEYVSSINISYFIVGVYVLSHIFGGLISGIYASRFPGKYEKHKINNLNIDFRKEDDNNDSKINNKKRRKKFQKPSSLVVFIFSVMLIFISFSFDDLDSGIALKVIIMLIRSIFILLIWYYFISPFLLKFLNKILSKRAKKRTEEIENIVNIFPLIKAIIKHSWNSAKNGGKLKRYLVFLDGVLINFLLTKK